MSGLNDILTHKIFTILSWLLSTFYSFRYFVGRDPLSHDNPYHSVNTPFTLNIVVTMVYWAVFLLMQILFVTQIFVPTVNNANGITNRLEVTKNIGWHFTAFNLFHWAWTILFVKHHYFWSEVILILNFLNILSLYFAHKTFSLRPFGNWFLIHMSTAAFPFSWLLMAIFWNGAVLFHVHKLVGRIVANVLVWLLFFIPASFVVVFNDWGIGITSSVLTFGLGLGQLFTKAFALQWIFGFIISGLLFVLTVIVASGWAIRRGVTSSSESAPLLEG